MRNILFILFLGVIQLTYAQRQLEPASINYTVEDGLPSNEVYCIHQDKKGYIWLGTDKGLCRYDGYEFKTFTIKDGLTDNVIFNIYEDDWGRLWFRTFNNTLCLYDGEFKEYKYNKKWKAFSKQFETELPINMIVVDKDSSLYLSIDTQGYLKLNNSGDISGEHTLWNIPHPKTSNVNFSIINNRIFQYTNATVTPWVKEDSIIINVNITEEKFSHRRLNNFAIPAISYQGQSFINPNFRAKSFVHVTDSIEVVPIGDQEIVSFLTIKGKHWLGYLKKGVETPSNNKILNGLSVSYILKDNQEGMWFATLEKGVFYIPNFHIFNFETDTEKKTGIVKSLFKDKFNSLYFGTKEGNLYRYKKDGFEIFHSNLSHDRLIYDSASHTVLTYKALHPKFVSLANKRETKIYHHASIDQVLITKNYYYFIQKWGLYQFKRNEKPKLLHSNPRIKNRILCLKRTSYYDFYLGTLNGVFSGEVDKKIDTIIINERIFPKDTSSNIRVNSIESIGANLWCSTTGRGIAILDKNQNETFIDTDDGLSSNTINDLKEDIFGNIWAASNKGIDLIDKKSKRVFRSINTSNGLLSNETFLLYPDDSLMWVATRKGISRIDLKGFLKVDSNNATPIISQFYVGDTSLSMDSIQHLKHDQNIIEINYTSFLFGSNGNITYAYRLLGSDSNWFSTPSRTARFLSLPHGKYTFEVKSQNKDGTWSPATLLSFTIHPAFWQTTWFLSLSILSILIIVSGIIIIRYRTVARRKELESSVERFRYRALTSQMNPHFVFNALNSIQYFILGQDRRTASKYLSTFARLIRASFENSKQELVPLEDELDALRLYMDLENLRLENRVELSFDVDSHINLVEIRVPPLLIQPFVENAFLHGLAPKKDGEMKLNVEVKDHPEYIYCKIEDNGIGRDAAKSLKKAKDLRRRKSSGMSMTEDRLDAFAQLQNLKDSNYKVEITDLFDDNNQPMGTVIELYIPKKLTAHS